jgi:tetratricopeptide (TPR) repeat protein
MTKFKFLSCSILLAASVALVPAVSLAAGSGGGSGGSTPSPTTSPKKMKCKKGQAVKMVMVNGTKKAKCVKVTAELVPAQDLYEQGYVLAKEGEYDWALDLLEVADQKNPDVLNMQGYSHRKAGRLDVAVGFYQQAIAMNPDFVRAREYLGEGYAAAGKLDLAKAQLAEIEKRCGKTCEEYEDLAKAISAASN